MANEYSSSAMYFAGDTDRVYLIGSQTTDFRYVDNTLDIENPSGEETRFASLTYSGRDLRDYSLGTRNIKLQVQIYGTDQNTLLNNVARLQRLFSIATSPFYLAGGAVQFANAFQSESFPDQGTGDQGLLFIFRMGKDGGPSLTSELGTSDSYSDNTLRARVLKTRFTNVNQQFSAESTITVTGTAKKVRTYEIELECEPLFTMRERRVATSSALSIGQVAPANGSNNRVIIASGTVLGTNPAPTRIMTQLSGAQGIIIGRDAGIYSALNAPSYPVFSGGGRNDLYTGGTYNNITGKQYKVKISGTGSPNQYQYSTNGGSSYSASFNISAGAINSLEGASSIVPYFWFESATGHNLNDTWTFNSHQTVQYINSTFDLYANRANAYTEDGVLVKDIHYTIPYGCHSRYKVYLVFSYTGHAPEVSAKMYYGGYNYSGAGGKLYSGGARFDWTSPATSANWVDVALIDTTANANPSAMHPYINSDILLQVYVRSKSAIANPATFNISYAYLVPCPDENSWFHAGWTDDGEQYEYYCNYDMANPYMVESSYPTAGGGRRAMPLNGTYGGNLITLIPQVQNTIVMLPVFTTNSDWRSSTLSTSGTTGAVEISYKPMYSVF